MPGLKSQIASLIKLQKVDTEIYSLKYKKQAKPEEIKAMDAEFEEKKQQMTALEKSSLDIQKLKKERELELSAKEESIKKLQNQLYQLKTNKEYQAMLKEIEDNKADASVIEDKILELMVQMDKIKSDIEKEKTKLKAEEDILTGKKKKIQDDIKEIDDRLAQLEAQRKQIIPEIDPKLLAQYERILANRDGLAIVAVKNFACQGCNMSVPAQTVNLIKMYERLVTCEVCNRLLYVEDEIS